MAVRADERVGIADTLGRLVHAGRQVLEIHLVDDADAGRHDLERVERLHAPLHELVALLVALELELHVEVERVLRAVVVDLYRVIDHQIDRHERLDHLRVLAHLGRRAAHRGEVAQERHAGEVLLLAVAIAQHRLEHDADRERQALHGQVEGAAERGQRIELTVLEFLQSVEGVVRHCVFLS